MAKEYDFCDFINLKELNIFYKSIIGIFKSNNIYGIIIDENHVSFMPNIEEAKKFIRIINLYSAILMIEKNNKDYLPKFSFSNNHDNEVIINNNGKKQSCYVVTMKDIRIDGNPYYDKLSPYVSQVGINYFNTNNVEIILPKDN